MEGSISGNTDCYRKQNGEGEVVQEAGTREERVEERKPCVGMCFRTRSSGNKYAQLRKQRRAAKMKKRPCIGLCYIAKIQKTTTKRPDLQAQQGETASSELQNKVVE